MEDIEILENMECGDDGELKQALTNAIQALKERQADKEKIEELESDNYECNNRIVRYMEELEIKDKMIDLMLEELTNCEFEMKCSECCCECEKDYDQLYECNKQYFENKAKVNLQSNKENIDTQDFKQKYQCEWNLKSNKESGEIDEG